MTYSQNDHDTTFLTTVFDPPSDEFFQGYCFVGSDLIFGGQGAQKFRQTTGRSVTPGLDGRYVQVTRSGTTYAFDTDFAGYEVLYYYHDGAIWAVSNSFAQIVDFLRTHNLRVTPNYAHLHSMTHKRMPAQQLFSLATIVREIQVVPPAHTLIITPSRGISRRRSSLRPIISDYKDSLGTYINLWVSRFETMMLDDTADFSTELTGGVDSRANLALLVAAARRLGRAGQQPRIVSNTGPRNQADLEIAYLLAEHYGFRINDGRKIATYQLSPEERFATFRDLSLGVYYPLYFPARGASPTDIAISGGGGGLHRRIYANTHQTNDVKKFIDVYAKKAGRPEYVFEFRRDANRMLEQILEPGDDPLHVLLRDGRVRYHTGRAARFGVSFAPLHSVSANKAQLSAGEQRLDRGQFNYDVMYSVDPELVDLPYDESSKLPNGAIRNDLVSAAVHETASPGQVWTGELNLSRKLPTSSNADIYSILRRELDTALENPFVTSFWGKEIIREARGLMNSLSSGKSIGNAVNGIPIHALLAADLGTPS